MIPEIIYYSEGAKKFYSVDIDNNWNWLLDSFTESLLRQKYVLFKKYIPQDENCKCFEFCNPGYFLIPPSK